MPVATFEGRDIYRIDYVMEESVHDGNVTREASAFIMAPSPEAALRALRLKLDPMAAKVINITMGIEGAAIMYEQAVA